MRTQKQIADGNNVFLELVNHATNPITAKELEMLVSKYPERYGRFEYYIPILEARENPRHRQGSR